MDSRPVNDVSGTGWFFFFFLSIAEESNCPCAVALFMKNVIINARFIKRLMTVITFFCSVLIREKRGDDSIIILDNAFNGVDDQLKVL